MSPYESWTREELIGWLDWYRTDYWETFLHTGILRNTIFGIYDDKQKKVVGYHCDSCKQEVLKTFEMSKQKRKELSEKKRLSCGSDYED